MHQRGFFYAILFVFVLASCGENQYKICIYSKKELLQDFGGRIFGTSTENKLINEFRDKGKDSLLAGYYSFNKGNCLSSYYFFIDLQNFVYSEEYDSLGNCLKKNGVPLVHNEVTIANDSASVKMYFFSLNKKYKNINVVTSDNRDLRIGLLPDTMFSNVKSAIFCYTNLNREQDIESHVYAQYENVLTTEIVSFSDTIKFHFRPNKQF